MRLAQYINYNKYLRKHVTLCVYSYYERINIVLYFLFYDRDCDEIFQTELQRSSREECLVSKDANTTRLIFSYGNISSYSTFLYDSEWLSAPTILYQCSNRNCSTSWSSRRSNT